MKIKSKNIILILIVSVILSCNMNIINQNESCSEDIVVLEIDDIGRIRLVDLCGNEIKDLYLIDFFNDIYINGLVLKDDMHLTIGEELNIATRLGNAEKCYHKWNDPTIISSGTHWHWFKKCYIVKYKSTCKNRCGSTNTFESHEYEE